MGTRKIKPDELADLVGSEFGVSEWISIDQTRIDLFADVTEDRQFIHVDVPAAAKAALGSTIAHGFLTLSLLTRLFENVALELEGMSMNMNYGLNKVRFLAPVLCGSNIRGRFTLTQVLEKRPGQYLLTFDVVVEIENNDKPALIVEWLVMQFVE